MVCLPELTEEGVFVKFYDELRRNVHPDDIAAALLARDVITDSEKAEVDLMMYTAPQRMDKLLPAVQRAIRIRSDKFHTFLKVLLDAAPKYEDLVVRMKAKLEGMKV